MSDWEEARPPRRGRTAVVIAALALAAIVLALALGPASSDDQIADLAIDDDPGVAVPASEDPIAWTPVQPGRWRRTPSAPLVPRVAHYMLWTGRSVIVWGGFDNAGLPLLDGGYFDPENGSWRQLPPFDGSADAPAVAVWTGDEALVVSSQATHAIDPVADRWDTRPAPPLPQGHAIEQVVGTGSGAALLLTRPVDAGATWQPALLATRRGGRRWQRLPDPPVEFAGGDLLVADERSAALVTGSLRGGLPDAVSIDLRGTEQTWKRLPPPPLPGQQPVRLIGGLVDQQIVLVGLDVLGGRALMFDDGGWRQIESPPPTLSAESLGLWSGDELLVWDLRTGESALLDPSSAAWTRLPRFPFGTGGFRPAVWTGADIVTWGGFDSVGGVYAVR